MHGGQSSDEEPESHDGTDDGMGCGDGKPQGCGQVEPDSRGKEGGEHPQNEQFRAGLEEIGRDDPLADRVGDVPSDEKRPREFEDRRQQDGLLQGDRVGSHGGPHGVCHVVGPDIPGHVDAGREGDPQNPGGETDHDPLLLG